MEYFKNNFSFYDQVKIFLTTLPLSLKNNRQKDPPKKKHFFFFLISQDEDEVAYMYLLAKKQKHY